MNNEEKQWADSEILLNCVYIVYVTFISNILVEGGNKICCIFEGRITIFLVFFLPSE